MLKGVKRIYIKYKKMVKLKIDTFIDTSFIYLRNGGKNVVNCFLSTITHFNC
jgi:hypothetical protein